MDAEQQKEDKQTNEYCKRHGAGTFTKTTLLPLPKKNA
jgi:hypothetical protein